MDFSSRELPGLFFRRVVRDDMGQVSLDPQMVRLLLAIDEDKPMAQVAKELGMSFATVRETLMKLVAAGLVEQVQKAPATLGAEFYADLKAELTVAVGPMADLLIEEVLDDLRVSGPAIPKHMAAEVVNSLARQIPREEARLAFQRAMIARIPK